MPILRKKHGLTAEAAVEKIVAALPVRKGIRSSRPREAHGRAHASSRAIFGVSPKNSRGRTCGKSPARRCRQPPDEHARAPDREVPAVFFSSLWLAEFLMSKDPALSTHGKDRQPLQAPGLYFPILRNLWRAQWLLGLRSAGSRAQTQPQGFLVAPQCSRTRRHGRHGRLDHHEPRRLEGQRTRGDLQRSDGGLPFVQVAPSRRSIARSKMA